MPMMYATDTMAICDSPPAFGSTAVKMMRGMYAEDWLHQRVRLARPSSHACSKMQSLSASIMPRFSRASISCRSGP
jgi:hypothetical protein